MINPNSNPPDRHTIYNQPPAVSNVKGSNSPVTATSRPKSKLPLILLILGLVIVLAAVFYFGRDFIGSLGQKQGSTITWWGLWEDESTLKSLITEYESKNSGVKINYVKQSHQDYRERLINSLAKGQGPDIFRFHNTWVAMLNNDLDNVPSAVMSATDFAKNYYPVITSDLSTGTGFVGLPLGYDAITLFINEDIFTAEGLTPPSTWNEMREVAKRLTKIENGTIVRAGVALGRTENVDHWPEILGLMMWQNGASLDNPTGDKAEDALAFYTLFAGVDKVWDATLPPSTVAFGAGNLAMYFGPSWRAFDFKAKNPNLKFKTVPLPQLPKDNPGEPDLSYATYWVEGVWARSNVKKQAWDFLKFISSKESLEKLYQAQSAVRGFGVAYPRRDMADLLKDHPVLGSIVKLAPDARSWFLASRTWDGPTGINSQINKYFEDAVNAVNAGKPAKTALETTASGVTQVLSQYKLIK